MRHTLSKSDFTLALSCPTKLYYRELRYPSRTEDDPFLELLADGGYMVQAIAKALVADVIDVDRGADLEGSAEATRAALGSENAALAEATFVSGVKVARVDILIKRGGAYEMIEVKSGGCDSDHLEPTGEAGVFRVPERGQKGMPRDWKAYLQDAAFQVHLLREVLGKDAIIRPMLQLPDTAKAASAALIHRQFSIRRVQEGARERKIVEFRGDTNALRAGGHFLTKIDITAEVDELLAEVSERADALAASLIPEPRRVTRALDVDCGKCEFGQVGGDAPSGFSECWRSLGEVKPHILELYHVGSKPVRPRADALIQSGRVGLFDLTRDDLRPKSGALSARGERQWIQIEHTRLRTPWVGAGLRDSIAAVRYPLSFIDFEASRLAVPYHAGMRPWEVLAFQWSCHGVSAPGAAPQASGWIKSDDGFPNHEFLASLRARLGDEGTVLTWGRFEIDVLREIARRAPDHDMVDGSLEPWLTALEEKRWIDMNDLCLAHYFHPAMGSSTSIKDVLDALWSSDPAMRAEFPEYASSPEDPYDALPTVTVEGREFAIAEGTGAVAAYQELLFGEFSDPAAAQSALREGLTRYCTLDTAAMVMIWNSWARAVMNGGPESGVQSPESGAGRK